MSLTSSPFHSATGDLLPSYRDAYLRGDLSGTNTTLVDAYLKANPAQGTDAYHRFHTLQGKGHAVRPVGWLQHQFELIRTEPARFRQRAGGLVLVAALLGGAAFAGTNLPTENTPTETFADAPTAELTTSAALATVSGRILNENGQPLVGATVLDKRSGRGVSTDAEGRYALAVPATQATQLQFGYGGYAEEDLQVAGRSEQNVTLLPRTDQPAKKHRWWPF